MNHLRITNKGLICAEDLTLIGSSTKRDQAGKIGMFGSGWKYALAWLLRNECKPVIYSGKKRIEIDSTVKLHRDNPVHIITVDGQETSLTTQMGPKWTGWMALREILSNAIDEGEHTLSTVWNPEFYGVDGQTSIFIPMNGELSEVMMKYDMYFAFNRKESYVTPFGRMFVKSEPSPMNVYRKGIRCFDSQLNSIIDFDFENIDINEDRLCSVYKIYDSVRHGLTQNTNPQILKHILLLGEEYTAYSIDSNSLECIKSLVNDGETFTTEGIQKLGGILFSNPNSIVIRTEWYKKLVDLGIIESAFDMKISSPFFRTDTRDMSGVKYYMDGIGVKINYQSGKCENAISFSNGTAYVRDDLQISDKDLAAEILGVMDADNFKEILS